MAIEKRKRKTSRRRASNGKSSFCFTVMPFGGWHDTYYQEIFEPAISEAGLVARRGDDLYRPSDIIHDIWDFTQKARVVLADLTGRNPNVFYELGLAHAIAKPAVLIADTMDAVPFDLRGLRTLIYDRNAPDWGRGLANDITKALREVMDDPRSAVPPAFLKVRPEPAKSVTPHELEIRQLRSDMDVLKKQVGYRVTRQFTYDSPMGQWVETTSARPGVARLSDLMQGRAGEVRTGAGVTIVDPPPQPTSDPRNAAVQEAPGSGIAGKNGF